MSMKWPVVSFILLTYNGGDGVRKCLQSVKDQSYPQNLIDVVVVDNGSKDDSVKIAKKFKARVFVHPKGDLYTNWVRGLHRTKGEFVFYLEQDIVLRGNDFIQKMIKPLLDDDRLIATFTKEQPKKDMHWVPRYLSYHVSQCDPLFEYLTTQIEETFIERHSSYIVCKYSLGKIPGVARMFYRIKYLKKTANWKAKNYFDHDFIIQCVKAGFPYFGYVPEPGYYHYHARDLKHLLQKRVRNLGLHFFPYNDETEYKWVDTRDKKQVLKMAWWVIYANLFFPATIRGFIRFLKHRDWVLLMEPIIVITITDTLLWAFLTNEVGQRMIKRSFTTLLRF
jgi:glycosyltransferase involved in cell wall biosynthesis